MTVAIPSALREHIEARMAAKVTSFIAVGGGCINETGIVTLDTGAFFLKWNDAEKYPGMLDAEANGLRLLAATEGLRVPEVLAVGVATHHQYLLLEYIKSGERTAAFWRTFGSGLAKLHATASDKFGLDHDNYIGSLPQRNAWHTSWTEFFVEERLRPQLRLSYDDGKSDHALLKKFDALFAKLPSLLVEEGPALVHGDLWSGNLMTNAAGEPVLIDPAVYYGNREADLAMMALFGGFDDEGIVQYHQVYPLQPGFRERLPLYQLYPLLVHINLFGGGYGNQVRAIINRFA